MGTQMFMVRKLLVLILAVAAWPVVAAAQGVRYDNVVLSGQGLPIAGANVAVCTVVATTSTTPCSPLVTIYSDRAETQPLGNPIQSTGLGNYGFFASPGSYLVQIYGGQLSTTVYTITLPCDPSAPNSCPMTGGLSTTSAVSTGTLSVTGNISATGTVSGSNIPSPIPSISGTITTGDCTKWASGTSLTDAGACGGNAAQKPALSDAVQFVSASGNDASDCLSWGSACKTIHQAWTNLYSNANKGGTIYIGAGAACTSTAGQGLDVYGNNDPNSGSPSAGWVHDMQVRLVGVGTAGSNVASAHVAAVALNCGSTTQPALQLSDTQAPMEFVNLAFTGIPAVVLGTCMSGANTCGVSAVTFEGDTINVAPSSTGQGPALVTYGQTFEVYFHDVTFANSSTGKTSGADASECVVINSGGGILYFHDITLIAGSLKDNNSGGSLYVDGVVTESQPDGHGAIWFPATVSGAVVNIKNVTVADALTVPTPAVEVDGKGPADAVVVQDVNGNGFNTTGPVTMLGGMSIGETSYSGSRASLEKQHQAGFYNGHIVGQGDAARRVFGPVAIPFANQASQLPSAWTANGPATITGGTTAPDGTTNAGHVTATGAAQADFTPISGVTMTLSAGDYVIGGAWARATTGRFQSGNGALNFTYGSCVIADISGSGTLGYSPLYITTANLWEWYFQVGKVTTGGTCGVVVAGVVDATNSADFYAPVLIRIPAGAVSDDEAAALALNLESWPDGPAVGAVATLRGHPLAIGGSGDNFFATLDHTALTSNQTYTLPATGGTLLTSSGTANVIPKFTAAGTIGNSALTDNGTLVQSSEEIQLTGTSYPNLDHEPVSYTTVNGIAQPLAAPWQIFRGTTASPIVGTSGAQNIFTEIVADSGSSGTGPAGIRVFAIQQAGTANTFAFDAECQTNTTAGGVGCIGFHATSEENAAGAAAFAAWLQAFDNGFSGGATPLELNVDSTAASRPYGADRGVNNIDFVGTGTTASSSGDPSNDWGILIEGFGYGLVWSNHLDPVSTGGYASATYHVIRIRNQGAATANANTTILDFESPQLGPFNYGLDFRNATFNNAGGCCAIVTAGSTLSEFGKLSIVPSVSNLAGTCVFASSTTCAVTFTNAYGTNPLCVASFVNGTVAAINAAANSTVLTLTAGASNSNTASWICIANGS